MEIYDSLKSGKVYEFLSLSNLIVLVSPDVIFIYAKLSKLRRKLGYHMRKASKYFSALPLVRGRDGETGSLIPYTPRKLTF